MSNSLPYTNYTIICSVSKNSVYHDRLREYFLDQNIHVLNLNKSNIILKVKNIIEYSVNDRIILIPPSSNIFKEEYFDNLNDKWKDDKLIIFNNSIKNNKKKSIIGFDKKYLNYNIIKYFNYNTLKYYIFNLYGSSVLNISIDQEESPSLTKPIYNIKRISIIISAYNAEEYIEECLDSIINQTYFKNNNNYYEILLGIDNCQNTLKKVQDIKHKYKNLHVYMMDSNEGPYITKNTLIPLSSYNNLLFFDSDDVMKDDMIENIFQNTDKFDMIRFSTLNFEEDKNKTTPGFVCHGCFFIKKEQFNKLGGFKPWRCSADTDFLKRMGYDQKDGKLFKCKHLSNSFYRRIHPQSLTKHDKTSRVSSLRKSYENKPYHIGEYVTPVTNTYQFDNFIMNPCSNPQTILEKKFCKDFIKPLYVDYDAVIIIPSYNRFEKLDRILRDLNEQKTKYKIKIIVYNDGSTDVNYNQLPKKYDIDYLKSDKNNNKQYYWKTINKLFKKASKYSSHVVIQIDDDHLLCDNFIDILMDYFFESKKISNRYIAIHYITHIINDNIRIKFWGYENGIDGGVLFDTNFLKEINFKILPIDPHRWDKNPNLSSGVWAQITETINKNNLLTYNLNHSLAKHDGNEDSKMNNSLRKNQPANTLNYKKDIQKWID